MFQVAGSGERAIHSSIQKSVMVGTFGAVLVLAACATAGAQTTSPPVPAKPASVSPQKAKPAPPPPQSGLPKDATPATVLDDKDVETALGREIYSIAGDDMGRLVDILVDHKGNVRAAIIDFGGFLGVGSRKIAVDWHAIQFNQDRTILSLTRDQVRVAPEYKDGEPVVVLGPGTVPAKPPHPQQNAKSAATAPAK
jgi:sporulation protein YlmC with PRC-barrel domain